MNATVEPIIVCDVNTDQQWTVYEVSLPENPQYATREQAERVALAVDKELKRLRQSRNPVADEGNLTGVAHRSYGN